MSAVSLRLSKHHLQNGTLPCVAHCCSFLDAPADLVSDPAEALVFINSVVNCIIAGATRLLTTTPIQTVIVRELRGWALSVHRYCT